MVRPSRPHMQARRLRYKEGDRNNADGTGGVVAEAREGAFTGGAWHPRMTLSSIRRRQRSELRPHPKEEAMSHALATVRHRARLDHGVAQRAKPEGRE